jgi:8-oxo-dGTP pyrophosphatase MutT (NUDIX family)
LGHVATPWARGPAAPASSQVREGATPQLQSGALVYRRAADGGLLILLISKSRSKDWGIPKGRIGVGLSLAQNAAKEAFEEAGVEGVVSANAVGMYRAAKRNAGDASDLVIEVWVYLLEATRRLQHWPEKGKRRIKWVRCGEAAALLKEPVLAELCRDLASG